MATKSRQNNGGDNVVAALQGQLDKIEAELAQVMTERSPGFSQTMLQLLDQARDVGLRLASTVSDQARVTAALERFDTLARDYTAACTRQDELAFLVNRTLLLTWQVMQAEVDHLDRVDDLRGQLDNLPNQFRSDAPDIHKQLVEKQSELEEVIEAEMKAPSARREIFGAPRIPDSVRHPFLELGRYFSHAIRKG